MFLRGNNYIFEEESRGLNTELVRFALGKGPGTHGTESVLHCVFLNQ